jgi:ribonucleoside-diphosphate reductase alpha chain
MGMTGNKEIPMVKSIMDYLGRWLALKFMTKDNAMRFHNHDLVEKSYREGTKSKDAFAMRLPVVDEGSPLRQEGQSAVSDFDTAAIREEEARNSEAEPSKLELAKQQGFTGSVCGACGSTKMKRNGSCEVCLDCGGTSGCS